MQMTNETAQKVVLEIAVRNHPGVMSHVCGLFARRAFNVEGILCMPVGDGDESRIWLLVFDDARLPQMIAQVEKLETCSACSATARITGCLSGWRSSSGEGRPHVLRGGDQAALSGAGRWWAGAGFSLRTNLTPRYAAASRAEARCLQ